MHITRVTLIVVASFVAITALAGGLAMLLPQGDPVLKLDPAWLEGSVFASYTVPAIALAFVGLLHAVAAWAVARRWRADWALGGASGGAMLVFELVEYMVVPFHWLQAFYAALGLLTGLLSIALIPRRGPVGARGGAGAAPPA